MKAIRADLAVFIAGLLGVPVKVRERYWEPKERSRASGASRSLHQGRLVSSSRPPSPTE
jgi:hypothetical protein